MQEVKCDTCYNCGVCGGEKQEYCCRWAPSLGELENTHQAVWGTKDYIYKEDKLKPTVFFGLYDVRDFWALWRHKGKRYVFWGGSDIEHLRQGFLFNSGKLKWLGRFCKWSIPLLIKLLKNCEHYVENEIQQRKLEALGLGARVQSSFLGKIEDFPITYKHSEKPNVFISGHPGREYEYGFDFVEELAKKVPECIFHLYGASWKSEKENIICHGRVSKEQFNKEIQNYQCGLRPNIADGASEIMVKSILNGGYPITRIKYSFVDYYETEEELIILLKALKNQKEPNIEARKWWVKNLNNFPWKCLNT